MWGGDSRRTMLYRDSRRTQQKRGPAWCLRTYAGNLSDERSGRANAPRVFAVFAKALGQCGVSGLQIRAVAAQHTLQRDIRPVRLKQSIHNVLLHIDAV